MLRLRQYKEADAEKIAQWVQDKDIFMKWGGELFGEYPINGDIIAGVYKDKNGLCKEKDNFYPWIAFDESGVVGHFIMRYLHGDNKILRFGWVIVDDNIRGKGYGTEMLRLGMKYAFEILGVEKITIGVFENNSRAHACYKKVGFHDTEIVKKAPWNVVEMEILKEEWMRGDK
ncbi:MAG: GNAT family N-acetyltransferase [Lachnospiraceae bacterium]|nr:GNAT family N-acetyltransferase [Lachnospiraceae bacterium]